MAIQKQQKKTSTRKEFKLPTQSEPSRQFGLEEQKGSLLKYNENIRTSKDIRFANNGRLQIPVFSSDPSVCMVGEIALIGGIMKFCSSTNTWSNI